MPWRLLLSPPLPGAQNMALDEALMARARRTGETVLRVYGWAQPTLSLGRNQRAVGVYRDDVLADRGIAVVRRPTGGRALLHHREVTYSVTAPARDDAPLRAVYAQVNLLLLDALSRLGVSAQAASTRSPAPKPTASPCFAEPALGEIAVGDRKLVGSAQWRDRGALLQHGSILLDDDQRMIPSLMRCSTPEPPRAATLRDAMGRAPVMTEVGDALFASVRVLADQGARALDFDEELHADAHRIAAHYRDDAWTWRR